MNAISNMNKSIRCRFICGAKVGDDIYAVTPYFNTLVRIDSKSGMPSHVGRFSNENDHQAYRNAVCFENRILFFPWKGTGIGVYDYLHDKLDYIRINRKGYMGEYTGLLIAGKVFLVPVHYNGDILILNPCSYTVEVWMSFRELTYYLQPQENHNLLFLRIATMGTKLVLPQYGTGRIIIIEANNKEDIKVVDIDGIRIKGGFSGKESIWLLDNNDCVIKIDYPCGSKKKYTSENTIGNKSEYNWIIENDNGVYIFPRKGNTIFKIEHEKMVPVFSFDESRCDKSKNLVQFPIVDGEDIWVLPFGYPEMLYINNDRFEYKKIGSLPVTNSMHRDFAREVFSESKDKIFFEKYNYCLGDYLAAMLYIC